MIEIETSTAVGVHREQSETATMVRQIAHELRQPLSTIESIAYYLDLILPRDDERARNQLDRLQKLVEQSNWIVSNAVHYVQASPAIPQNLDLAELTRSAAAECRMATLVRLAFSEPAHVRLDPSQAVHLFGNLLTFYRTIISREYPLDVSVRSASGWTRVRFHTSAPGHGAYQVRSMFEAFNPSLPSGAGLSLASVRRIVEAHEGSVEIEASPSDGVGITLVLPA